MWVEMLTALEFNPVLLYKTQGMMAEDGALDLKGFSASDFILCIQTKDQLEYLLQFGCGRAICMDSTHGTNPYDFHLITVMVIDDFGEGIPVAFMICNREDETALQAFLSSIKHRIPESESFAPSYLMTDDAPQYHNAWCAVFGVTKKLLCTWHVDRAWRKNIRELIPQAETQVEVYHMLRTLLQLLNTEEFDVASTNFLQFCRSQCPKFVDYFERYVCRASEWAYCYRIGTQTNTNMYIESFHNVLKTSYMDRKVNRRIDSLLDILLRVARDKVFERLIKVAKNGQSKKQHEISKRHCVLTNTLVPNDETDLKNGWRVPSSSDSDVYYHVMPAEENCDCRLRCHICKCCVHMYVCNCVDFAVHAVVCKHIHTVHHLRTVLCNAVNAKNVSTEYQPPQLVADCNPTHSDHSEQVENDRLLNTDNKLAALRRQILSFSTRIHDLLINCSELKALETALKHMKAAEASLIALQSDSGRTLTGSTILPARQWAAGKKLDKQLRFFSTKAKRRAVQTALRKPHRNDVQNLRCALLGKSRHSVEHHYSKEGIGSIVTLS